MRYLGTISKMTAWSWFISKANHSNIIVIQVYAPTTDAEEAEVKWFYEDLQDLLELTPKEDVLFITGNWNAKVDSQGIPGITGKFGLGVQNEAGQGLTGVLPRECTGHSKHPLQTNTRDDSTHGHHQMGQYWNHIDYILCSWRWKCSIQWAKTRPGTDCGSDHKLFIAKFRLK